MKPCGLVVWRRTASATSTSPSLTMRRPPLNPFSRTSSFLGCTSASAVFTSRRLSSTDASSSLEQPRRRRSKRLSYADADRVYAADAANRVRGSDGSSALQASSASSFQQVMTQQRQRDRLGLLGRLHTYLQQRWQVTLLTLLRTQYVGAVVVRLLEASAYTAYLKGSVVLFTRQSVSPPITASASAEVATSETTAVAASSSDRLRSTAASPTTTTTTASSTLLRAHALDCLYVGRSRIHSRGLFTRAALPKGTRVIAEPHRSLLLASHFLTLLADTHEKLPDTWHYTQPTGSVVELVTQAQPHHLMNHSCRSNVCSGLSHVFWGAALLAAEGQQKERNSEHAAPTTDAADMAVSSRDEASAAPLQERLTQWPHFADANSFFLTRDVAAGEELTLDYSTRMAPLYAGESRHGMQAQGWLLCRCGEPCCRHYVYRHSAAAAAYLHQLQTRSTSRPAAMEEKQPLRVAARLLELGFDDELVLLSYAGRPSDVVAYLYGEPLPSFSEKGSAQVGIDTERRRVSKTKLIMSYRHVFRLLNEAVPETPCCTTTTAMDEKNEKDGGTGKESPSSVDGR